MDPSVDPQDLPAKIVAFIIALSILGGLAHYTDRVRRGKLRAHWSLELLGDTLYSMASGFTLWYLAIGAGSSEYLAAGSAIVGGHLGARFMFMAQEALVERTLRSLKSNNDKPTEDE